MARGPERVRTVELSSKAAVSAPVTTRQIVDFDGGPAPGRATAPPVKFFQHISGYISSPTGDRGERPGPGDLWGARSLPGL